MEKIIILIGMLAATLIFALLPMKLVGVASSSRRDFVIKMASCFSGGVFLAACLLDLFPDVHEAMDHVLDEIERKYDTEIDYPFAEFVIVLGFFLVLIVEQVMLDCNEKWHDGDNHDETSPIVPGDESTTSRQYGSIQSDESNEELRITGVAPDDTEQDTGCHNHMDNMLQPFHSTLRSMMLFIALSFHSVFEGLAIGLQKDEAQLFSLFLAVICHKAVMAFSLGLTLAQAHLSVRQVIVADLIFSAASPLGMAIGIVISDMPHSLTKDVANSVLQGLAAGTFLYITFFEVLPHELNQSKHRLIKVIFVILGYSSICAVLFVTH